MTTTTKTTDTTGKTGDSPGRTDHETSTSTPETGKVIPPPSAKPPRGPSVRMVLTVVLVAILAMTLGAAFNQNLHTAWTAASSYLGIGQDHDQHAPTEKAEGAGGVQYYTCGMHPWVILPKPGNCPICSMELTPLDPKKFTGEIVIDPVVVQNMGVRIAPVVTGPLVKTIRTVGSVDYNERLVRDVNIKVSGWIEKLYVDYLGAEVVEGEKLFDVYSPDLYAAQEEYLLALHSRGKVGATFVPEAAKGAADLLESARTRLLYYDITPEQIKQLKASDKPSKTMAILSPHRGVVIEKHANEGMNVNPGMRVYRIADLSRVWVMVTLYEYQLPYVQTGQKAVMTLPYIPGQSFEGTVVYIYPYLEKKTREVQVRLEFENPHKLLKPGMFANIELQNTLAQRRTLAPREAIIDTGERQVAFVSLGDGKFEPRQVQMGVETRDGMVEILNGLSPGEQVVVSGQFLIDSEANIRESLAKMIRGNMATGQKPAVNVSPGGALASLPDAAASRLNDMLDTYLAIGDRLAGDSTDGLAVDVKHFMENLEALTSTAIPDDPHFWHKHDEIVKLRSSAQKLGKTTTLEEARLGFADLSVAMSALLHATGVPVSYPTQVQELHCPMFLQGQGGSIWLQPAGDVRNPFLGSRMISCFDKRTALPVTEAGPDAVPAPSATPPKNPQPGNDPRSKP